MCSNSRTHSPSVSSLVGFSFPNFLLLPISKTLLFVLWRVKLGLTAPTLCWPSQLAIEFFQRRVVLVLLLLMDMTALVADLSPWHFSIFEPKERQRLVP